MSCNFSELSDERLRELHHIYKDAADALGDQLKQRHFKRTWKRTIASLLETVKILLSEVCAEMDNRSPKPMLIDVFSINKIVTVKL